MGMSGTGVGGSAQTGWPGPGLLKPFLDTGF